MAGYAKIDDGILQSSVWADRDARDVLITALLLARPKETKEPISQLEVKSLKPTGWTVTPGWYGFVAASPDGLLRTACIPEAEGFATLERMGSPEAMSRSSAFDGRRLVRVDGGFLLLNYNEYQSKDYTSAERMRRYRANVKLKANGKRQRKAPSLSVTDRNEVTKLRIQDHTHIGETPSTAAISESECIAIGRLASTERAPWED
jgi:hypothetical protein